jgi:hypothetical protein
MGESIEYCIANGGEKCECKNVKKILDFDFSMSCLLSS